MHWGSLRTSPFMIMKNFLINCKGAKECFYGGGIPMMIMKIVNACPPPPISQDFQVKYLSAARRYLNVVCGGTPWRHVPLCQSFFPFICSSSCLNYSITYCCAWRPFANKVLLFSGEIYTVSQNLLIGEILEFHTVESVKRGCLDCQNQ